MAEHRCRRSILPGCSALALLAAVATAAAPFPSRSGAAKPPQFEQDVLPILTARCLKCHGADKPKAKLDLRTPAGMLKGGESGPALVPGSSAKSLLFEMIRKGEMPPKPGTLTTAQVAVVKAWIDAGAPAGSATSATDTRVTEQDRLFWSFQKPVRPPVPAVRDVCRVRTPIDAFVLAKLEARGLTFTTDASPAVLVRRLYFDLLGLPPSPNDVAAFLADTRPDAYERLVDRLLGSPHHGERWGRHWLDAAGYADSIGGDNDPGQVFPREGMYRYRDYVVRALNEDVPFDRFLTEQIAGDELDDHRSAAKLTPARLERLIATGFLRTTVDHTFEDELNRPFERYQVLHDTIENLTSNLLGLTVACARCHDHKFDPIPQMEYYHLLAVLKPIYNPEKWIQPQDRHLAEVSPQDQQAIFRQLVPLRLLWGSPLSAFTTLQAGVGVAARNPTGKFQAAWEPSGDVLPPTYLFRRGNHVTPAGEVQPGVFSALTDPKNPTHIPAPKPGAVSSGRRTAWSRWLTRPDHPLTSRVFVNRVWARYFGEGIVATPDNFGRLGARPTHPELLDWLAVEFAQRGWNVKALHRLVVTSTTYRQSSLARPEVEALDPGNQLLGRMRLRRLESEAVRDAVLAVSGQLDRSLGGLPVPIEPQPDGLVVVARKGLPSPTAPWRRSLYLFARRNYNLTLLSVFDQPVMATNCVRRVHSAVPLQSLTLLNDAFMLEQADRFAARVAGGSPDVEQQVETAFRLAFARNPTKKEVASSLALLANLRSRYAAENLPSAQVELHALARLCHVLLCANEFLYVG